MQTLYGIRCSDRFRVVRNGDRGYMAFFGMDLIGTASTGGGGG